MKREEGGENAEEFNKSEIEIWIFVFAAPDIQAGERKGYEDTG